MADGLDAEIEALRAELASLKSEFGSSPTPSPEMGPPYELSTKYGANQAVSALSDPDIHLMPDTREQLLGQYQNFEDQYVRYDPIALRANMADVGKEAAIAGVGALVGGGLGSMNRGASFLSRAGSALGAGAASAGAQTLAAEGLESLGVGSDTNAADRFLSSAAVESALPIAAEAYMSGRTALPAIRNWWKGTRATPARVAYDSAFTEGAIAAQGHNVPKGTGERAQMRINPLADIEADWLARNPVEGLDPTGVNAARGDGVYSSYRNRLEQLKTSGIEKKTSALTEAAKIQNETGVAPQYPFEFDSKLSSEIAPSIAKKNAGLPMSPEELERANEIQNVIAEKRAPFFEARPKINPQTGEQEVEFIPKGKLGVAEINREIETIDQELSDLGAYSENAALARFQERPVAYEARIEALHRYRRAYKDAMGDFLGSEQVTKQASGNLKDRYLDGLADYSVGVRYGKAADSFAGESLQGLTPGTASSIVAGQKQPITGLSPNQLLRAGPLGGASPAEQIRSNNLFRGADAIKAMQAVVGYRMGQMQAPISRRWDIIKNSPAMRGQIADAAFNFGLLMDPTRFQYMSEPQQEQIARSLSQMSPEMFEQPKGNLYSEFDGIVEDPLEKDYLIKRGYQLYKDDPSRRADVLGPAISEGRIVDSPATEQRQSMMPQVNALELYPQVDGGFGLPQTMSMVEDGQRSEYYSLEEMLKDKAASYQSTPQ